MEDRGLLIKGLMGAFGAWILVMFLLYLPSFADYFRSNDYYMERVEVLFNPPQVVETLSFKILEEGFHQIYKVYYGDPSEVEKVECLSGGQPYRDPTQEGVELGCSFPSLKPGLYTLRITYRVEGWPHLVWVVFNEVPRKVVSVSSNGYVPFTSSHMGEPVVAVFNPSIWDYLYFFLLRLFILLPFLTPILFAFSVYYLYTRYGRDVTEGEIPDTFHTLPNESRLPEDVVLFFTGSPDSADVGKLERVVNAALANAVVEGAVEVGKDNRVMLKDEKKLESLPKLERFIVEKLINVPPSKVTPAIAKSLEWEVKEYFRRTLPSFYDAKGDRLFYGVTVVLALLLYFRSYLGGWVYSIFPVLGETFIQTIITTSLASFLVMSTVFKLLAPYVLGRYRRDFYRERLLWEGFRNLLKNESRMAEYSLADEKMWGKWLVYAYALGVPSRVIKLLSKRAGLPKAAHLSHYGSKVRWTPTPKARRRSLGRGFRGGGTFGVR